jgi:hypothetical protein
MRRSFSLWTLIFMSWRTPDSIHTCTRTLLFVGVSGEPDVGLTAPQVDWQRHSWAASRAQGSRCTHIGPDAKLASRKPEGSRKTTCDN